MPRLRSTPPRAFREGVSQDELELRGVRARAFQFPEGVKDHARAVVCIAGMGANGRSFVRQRPLAEDYFLLLLNTPFETPRRADPLEFVVDCVEEYLESERVRGAVLVGSSFGGAASVRLALRRPDLVRGLVLAGAVLSRKQIPLATPLFVDVLESPEPIARLVAPIAAQVMGGFHLDRAGRDELVREARHFTGEELKRRLEALFSLDLFPALADLRCPTLVVHGNRDFLVPWRRGKWAHEAIHGSRWELIKKAGHVPYLSHAEEFNGILHGWLEDVFARG